MNKLPWIFLLVLSFFFVSCKDDPRAKLGDFDIKPYQPSYAVGFDILQSAEGQSRIIEVRNPWQGASNVVTRLFIARNGEAAPAGFEGQILVGEAKRIICMSSTQVAMLDAVGQVERTVGVLGRDFVSNPYVVEHREQIADIGREGRIDYEQILALNPDIVLLFGLNGASPMEPKLRELQIPFIYIGDYLENSPLGKAEWMVCVAEIMGKRDEGARRFAAIPQRYKALQKLVAEANITNKPKVMLNSPYRDSWVMAPRDGYVAQLIADAGGDYIFADDDGSTRSQTIDIEQAFTLAHQADFWVNLGTIANLAEFKAQLPKFSDIPCVLRGGVYNSNKKTNAFGGNDYWESGVLQPDVVLRDLISIFHPDLIQAERVYYQQLR